MTRLFPPQPMPRPSKTKIILSGIRAPRSRGPRVSVVDRISFHCAGNPGQRQRGQLWRARAGAAALVDDLVARYETVTGKPAVPAEMYDGLALSTKTTFNAVTHALSRTPLTDSAGRSMNLTALDLIAKVDAVAGESRARAAISNFASTCSCGLTRNNYSSSHANSAGRWTTRSITGAIPSVSADPAARRRSSFRSRATARTVTSTSTIDRANFQSC